MNKQGEQKSLVVILVILAVVILGVYLLMQGTTKTLKEHEEPADISEGESGTGMKFKFYDKEGNLIETPDWFTTASVVNMGPFSIVKRSPATPCTTDADCPKGDCYLNECVLRERYYLGIDMSVTTSGEVPFKSVYPSTVEPAVWSSDLDKTSADLSPTNPSHTFSMKSCTTDADCVGKCMADLFCAMDLSNFEGTTQTFNVVVSGTNTYTNEIVTANDTVPLAFDTDPTGAFTVSIISPI